MQRRLFIQSLAATASTSALPLLAQSAKPQVEVWKDPSCGCCKDWIAHMQSSGFSVTTHDSGNTAARTRLGLAAKTGFLPHRLGGRLCRRRPCARQRRETPAQGTPKGARSGRARHAGRITRHGRHLNTAAARTGMRCCWSRQTAAHALFPAIDPSPRRTLMNTLIAPVLVALMAVTGALLPATCPDGPQRPWEGTGICARRCKLRPCPTAW
jgi:hypothetical protein